MTEKLKLALYALMGLGIFLFWLHSCHDPSVRATQKLADSTVVVNAHSHQTDLRVARLAAESLELGARLMRLQRNDSVARREIARLHMATIITTATLDSAPRDTLLAQLAIRDTIISEQDSVIAAQSEQLTIWKALAVERGELLQRALQERDGYRNIASAWQRKAEPGALTKLGRALPYIAAGFVLAKVIR